MAHTQIDRHVTGWKPLVLAFADYYLPGFKAGGPIRSLQSLTAGLAEDVRFAIVTRDRDLGDILPYPGVNVGVWTDLGPTKVLYGTPLHLSMPGILWILLRSRFDFIYLNSFFSRLTISVLLLRRCGVRRSVPVIFAPRGELAASALAFSKHRKRLYIAVGRALGLWRGITWQAASLHEREDIEAMLGPEQDNRILLLPQLMIRGSHGETPCQRSKRPNLLRVVFVSRISPVKNLHMALEVLRGVRGDVDFEIFGPIEDPSYWRLCQEKMATMPANIRVAYGGVLRPDQVLNVLEGKDLFFLPTLGENFGHAVIEAMTAGCPVLISDRTPWRDLERSGAGWDLPLSEVDSFRNKIDALVSMGSEDFDALSRGVRAYADEVLENYTNLEGHRALFLSTSEPRSVKMSSASQPTVVT